VRLEARPLELRTHSAWGACLGAEHPQHTHGTWVAATTLDTPLRTTWRWDTCLGAGQTLRTHDAWAALGVSHAHAPLGDTWHVGYGARPRSLSPKILNIIVLF